VLGNRVGKFHGCESTEPRGRLGLTPK
jgi:hypothetical protein